MSISGISFSDSSDSLDVEDRDLVGDVSFVSPIKSAREAIQPSPGARSGASTPFAKGRVRSLSSEDRGSGGSPLMKAKKISPFAAASFSPAVNIKKYGKNAGLLGAAAAQSESRDDYVLRAPEGGRPAIVIDSHQAKHTSGWPTEKPYVGKRGSQFPPGRETTVEIARRLVQNELCDFLNRAPKSGEDVPSTLKIEVGEDKRLLELLNRKKKDNPIISISSGYIRDIDAWSIHIFPEESVRRVK